MVDGIASVVPRGRDCRRYGEAVPSIRCHAIAQHNVPEVIERVARFGPVIDRSVHRPRMPLFKVVWEEGCVVLRRYETRRRKPTLWWRAGARVGTWRLFQFACGAGGAGEPNVWVFAGCGGHAVPPSTASVAAFIFF